MSVLFKEKANEMESFLFEGFTQRLRNFTVRAMHIAKILYLIGGIIGTIVLFYYAFDEGDIGLLLLSPVLGILTYIIGFGVSYLAILPLVFFANLLDKVEIIKNNVCYMANSNDISYEEKNDAVLNYNAKNNQTYTKDNVYSKLKQINNSGTIFPTYSKKYYDKWLENGFISQEDYEKLMKGE